MASILDILNTKMGEDFIFEVSQRTSESEDKVSAGLGIALPILLAAMKTNISTPEGRESLNKALAEEKHLKKITDKSPGFDFPETDYKNDKIIGHILGPEKDKILSSLGTTVQMKDSSISYIFESAGSLLMGILSTQKKKENINASGLDELIHSALGSSSKFDKSLIGTYFNQNKDGSIIDDIDKKILGVNNGKKDGGVLGGMLGGK